MVVVSKIPILFVVGATASGKTELALSLAEILKFPIVNCDSVQIYRDLVIGSARPTDEEMQRVPHHLFGHQVSGSQYDVSSYVDEVTDLFKNKELKSALFCGGSGFYLQALEKGLFPKQTVSVELKERAQVMSEEMGFEKLHQWVCQRDPDHGKKFHFNDHYRVLRAAEILLSSSKTVTELKDEMAKASFSPLPPSQCWKMGLFWERHEQKERLLRRALQMFEMGWIDEVKALLRTNSLDWPPLATVGYKQVIQGIQEGWAQEKLVQEVVQANMQLIKKQGTWFKKQKHIQWFHGSQLKQAEDWAVSQVEDFLT